MLILVTLLWGLSFVLMKNWQSAAAGCPGGPALASLTFIAVRMSLAFVLLRLVQPRLFASATRREHCVGAITGSTFFVGFLLQILGISWTTPAVSAFITSLGSAWVPLIGWLWFGLPVGLATLLGLGIGVGGTAVLSLSTGQITSWNIGDALTLGASILFALEILLLDRLGRRVNAERITPAFFGVTALAALILAPVLSLTTCGIPAWSRWTAHMLSNGLVLRDMALLVTLSTVLAFQWMNAYQTHVAASRAALIYLLEPVFASAFSLTFGGDTLSLRLLAGGGLIMLGNVIAELPNLLPGRATNPV